MNSNHSLIYLQPDQQTTYSYNILDQIHVDITVLDNPFHIQLDSLFSMAARMNKKRSFLFVSKVLGKHLPVDPAVSLLTGEALAALYAEKVYGMRHPYIQDMINGITGKSTPNLRLLDYLIELPERTVFIGFAETATALGHAVFEVFENARFFHTTRERVKGLESAISFEEEHSHATSHRSYIDPSYLDNLDPVVLVDDEVTTGKTALNIIESIHAKFPRKVYSVVSILDWRTEENRRKFRELEQKLGITIHEISMISGTIEVSGASIEGEQNKPAFPALETDLEVLDASGLEIPLTPYHSEEGVSAPYLKDTGRFGMLDSRQTKIEEWLEPLAGYLAGKRRGSRTLCLGTGEFMFLPMKLASLMGTGVSYQSTTRSPIHPSPSFGYAISQAFSYRSPEDPDITHYFYNIEPGMYDDVFVFMEREMDEADLEPMIRQLSKVIPSIVIVPLSRLSKEG
ncbi:phosphoribosyltransferase family protein [Peribacillus kribbensis]|uniref:phosphoribosyltransferase family protein n=1 Tax=Peribacillus kribbensis TaxID=356658 RepID=UPI00047A7583|nr:phosphoribosyltransferase family protein [Peribacillus kribbensis]